MLSKTHGSFTLLSRFLLLALLLSTGLPALAETDITTLVGKVPPPPRDVAEATAQCGQSDYRKNNLPWVNFDAVIKGVDDEMQKETKQLATPDLAAEAMQYQMENPEGVAQYTQMMMQKPMPQYAQTGNKLFTPPYNDLQDTLDGIQQSETAKLKKCPVMHSEAGDYAIPSCGNPIEADANNKRKAAVDDYLAKVMKGWPQFIATVKNDVAHAILVPDGADPNNAWTKQQILGQRGGQIAILKDAGKLSQDICGKAVNALPSE